jgi:hypothetical protein
MTTTATAHRTEIETAADAMTAALGRLAELARADYTIASAVHALDTLTATGGPLFALSRTLRDLASDLADFEHQDTDLAADWLDAAASDAATAADHVTTAADYIRDLAE